jgi:RNA polymerase sigma-70 factor (ECF subfamily)
MPTDAGMAQRLLNGDSDALRQVYHQYKHDLLTVAMAILCDVHAAEDCVHDVFAQFAGGAKDVQVDRNLRGYLMRCVANRAKNRIKQEHVRRSHAARESQEPASDSPAGRLIATEQSLRVFRALAELPVEQREVITLHLHAEMTFREIALQLGHSINTVQSRYRYGIEKLRPLL